MGSEVLWACKPVTVKASIARISKVFFTVISVVLVLCNCPLSPQSLDKAVLHDGGIATRF
jgi:hypothetical protein